MRWPRGGTVDGWRSVPSWNDRRRVMAGFSGRWLVTASLAGLLGSPLAALAQTGRSWVDPPPVSDTKTRPPASAPATLPAPPAQAAPPPASPAEARTSTDAQPAEGASPRETVAVQQTKQKTAAERKVRASSRASASASSRKREAQVTRRRAAAAQVSQAERRRERATRYGSVQEGLDAGLQVMRLRTIQLPDGRRFNVLTRPDQDIASGWPDGY